MIKGGFVMLTKKQYISMLIAASIVFLAIFGIAYIYTINHVEPIPIEKEDELYSENEIDLDTQSIAEVSNIQNVTILPSTKVEMRILDQDNNIISQEIIPTTSLLGLSQNEVKNLFKEYEIIYFNPDQVLLEKTRYIEPKEPEYKLGIENGEIGIITLSDQREFTSLGIAVKDFSKRTHMLLMNEMISLKPAQKEELQKDPYYIEYILQNYSE